MSCFSGDILVGIFGIISDWSWHIFRIVTKKCDTITDLQLDGGNLTDEGVEMLSEVKMWRHDYWLFCYVNFDDVYCHQWAFIRKTHPHRYPPISQLNPPIPATVSTKTAYSVLWQSNRRRYSWLPHSPILGGVVIDSSTFLLRYRICWCLLQTSSFYEDSRNHRVQWVFLSKWLVVTVVLFMNFIKA